MHVRRYQPEDLRPLLDFIARHYPQTHKADERYFHWRFACNPLGSSLPDYALASEDGSIVGQMGALRDRLVVGGQWHDALWLIDLMVAPEQRGSLTALRLFQALMEQNKLLLATGAGPHMLKLYQALAWRRLPVMDSYYYPIRPGRLLRMAQEHAGWKMKLARPGLVVADAALPSLRRLGMPRSLPRRSGASLCPLERFDERVDRFIEQVQPSLGITCFRSGELLEWKFNRRPIGAHWAVAAESTASGEMRGYLVAKQMERAGAARWVEVVDYLVEPDDLAVLRVLLAWLERRSLEAGADFIRFRLADPRHKALLASPGWIRRTLPVSDEIFAWSPDPALLDRLAAGPWHLTSLVSDRADYGRDEFPS